MATILPFPPRDTAAVRALYARIRSIDEIVRDARMREFERRIVGERDGDPKAAA